MTTIDVRSLLSILSGLCISDLHDQLRHSFLHQYCILRRRHPSSLISSRPYLPRRLLGHPRCWLLSAGCPKLQQNPDLFLLLRLFSSACAPPDLIPAAAVTALSFLDLSPATSLMTGRPSLLGVSLHLFELASPADVSTPNSLECRLAFLIYPLSLLLRFSRTSSCCPICSNCSRDFLFTCSPLRSSLFQ